jgi:hypothetical protein
MLQSPGAMEPSERWHYVQKGGFWEAESPILRSRTAELTILYVVATLFEDPQDLIKLCLKTGIDE